jgi:hypothetical protein
LIIGTTQRVANRRAKRAGLTWRNLPLASLLGSARFLGWGAVTRDPYYIVRDAVNFARRFLQVENVLVETPPPGSELPYPVPVWQIEKDLALAAFGFNQYYTEYSRDCDSLSPHPFSISLRRELETIPELIDARLRRWRWDYVLRADGIALVKERIKNHEDTKERALLDAARSRGLGKNLARHAGADDLFDRAERLGVAPTMTPEEADRVIWERYRQWFMSPALGEEIPRVSDAEHGQLGHAVDELERHFRRVISPDQLREYAVQNEREAASMASAPDHPSDPPERFAKGDVQRQTPNRTSAHGRKKTGRPPDTDVNQDRRLFEAWRSGKHESLEALGNTFMMTKLEVKWALDRHRKRLKSDGSGQARRPL